jgi:hypothetical protein
MVLITRKPVARRATSRSGRWISIFVQKIHLPPCNFKNYILPQTKIVIMAKITVKDTEIKTIKVNGTDYICITDIARQKNPVEPQP